MFKQKYANKLAEEHYTTNIGESDEEFELRHLDPQSRPTLKEIFETISLMKTKQDWQNIIPFLSGLRMSKRTLKEDRSEWLVRKAAEANALGILFECAKQADRTGFRLNNVGAVSRYFFELHRLAQSGGFQGDALEKALRLAEQAALLMDDPVHVAMDPAKDPRRSPAVIGVLFELSAARAVNELSRKDEDGRVLTYTKRLLGSWSSSSFNGNTTDPFEIDVLFRQSVPIAHGIKLALKVNTVSKELGGRLQARGKELQQRIESLKERIPDDVRKNPPLGYRQTALLQQ